MPFDYCEVIKESQPKLTVATNLTWQSLILAALIRRPFITSQAFFSVNMNALREQY